jgi:hypothetical protein
MTATQLLTLPIVLGALFLLWAFAARRSPFDAGLIGLAGLLLILVGLRDHLAPAVERQLGVWPELGLGALGLVMLLRVFLSRLGWPHRVGLGLAGCAVTLPLLVLIGLIVLFSVGANHDRHRPPAANEAQANRS